MNLIDNVEIFNISLPNFRERIKNFRNSDKMESELDRISHLLNLNFTKTSLSLLSSLLHSFKNNYEVSKRSNLGHSLNVFGIDYIGSDKANLEIISNLKESIDLKLNQEDEDMSDNSEPTIKEINDMVNRLKKEDENRENYIFISHSMKDVKKARKLVDYLEKLGVDTEIIICTSVEKYSPEVGEDIIDYLKQKIKKDSLFIYIASEEYFSSYFCLNEMGAAWATIEAKNHFILKGQDFDLQSNLSRTVIRNTMKYTEYSEKGFTDLFEFLKKRKYVEELGSSKFKHILDLVNL
ncbi:TIR domain-containing protein [Staphylococcus nepalensis]|uniref:TIR domain-containing protein n=1 Tax=Staphylococcus nepalensis TaxID=214473 RepID=UPI001A97FE49|nr:TIR domain-containing protein [Staphylococcus nepalensis]MBO1217467.1 TIR domain-containing protein [Staphylococcus nepalensis]MBO1222757.1 TIR domain-containing protein [Staphylococcus nepalensis]